MDLLGLARCGVGLAAHHEALASILADALKLLLLEATAEVREQRTSYDFPQLLPAALGQQLGILTLAQVKAIVHTLKIKLQILNQPLTHPHLSTHLIPTSSSLLPRIITGEDGYNFKLMSQQFLTNFSVIAVKYIESDCCFYLGN